MMHLHLQRSLLCYDFFSIRLINFMFLWWYIFTFRGHCYAMTFFPSGLSISCFYDDTSSPSEVTAMLWLFFHQAYQFHVFMMIHLHLQRSLLCYDFFSIRLINLMFLWWYIFTFRGHCYAMTFFPSGLSISCFYDDTSSPSEVTAMLWLFFHQAYQFHVFMMMHLHLHLQRSLLCYDFFSIRLINFMFLYKNTRSYLKDYEAQYAG